MGRTQSDRFRLQPTLEGVKRGIGLLRFVKTVIFFKDRDGDNFEWSSVARTFGVDDEPALGAYKKWMSTLWTEELSTIRVRDQTQDTRKDTDENVGQTGRPDAPLVTRFIDALEHEDFDKIAVMIGLHPLILEKYGGSSTEHSLKRRFMEHVKQLRSSQKKKTTSDYIGPLWLNERESDLWKKGEDLLITPGRAYKWLTEYASGTIKMKGNSPSIYDVVEKGVHFAVEGDRSKETMTSTTVSASTMAKYCAALGRFQKIQAALLGIRLDPIGSDLDIKNFLANMVVEEPTNNLKRDLDRHRRVYHSDFDIDQKLKESKIWLANGSSCMLRDRAASLATAFSISRYGETSVWDIADCFVFEYETSLPSVGRQAIDSMYVIQHSTKTKCDNLMELWNLVPRHKDALQCPLSAIALSLFVRFHCDFEAFPNLRGPKSSWYKTKLFPRSHDCTKETSRAVSYKRKRSFMKTAGTLQKAVLHSDRHWGALYAKLVGVGAKDLSQLGFWESNVKTRCYTNIHMPDVAAKIGGFKNGAHFFLARNVIDPSSIDDPEVQHLCGGVFPQIDDPSWIEEVNKKCQGDSETSDFAARNVMKLFRLFRKVLLQDACTLYDNYPNLPMFESTVFKDNWAGFQTWHKIQSEVCKELGTCEEDGTCPPTVASTSSQLPGSIVSAYDTVPDGFETVPLIGSTHLRLLQRARGVRMMPASSEEARLPKISTAYGDTTNSLYGLWGISEKNRADLITVKTQLQKLTSLLTERVESENRAHGSLGEQVTILEGRPVVEAEAERSGEDPSPWLFEGVEKRPPKDQPVKKSTFEVERLPELSKYTLKEVYMEWRVKMVIGGKEYNRCLGEYERRRIEEDEVYRNVHDRGLKSSIQKRRKLVEHIEDVSSCRDISTDEAIDYICTEMGRAHGTWTLNMLYNSICGYHKKKKAKASV